MYIPNIGDVILNNEVPSVVVAIKNHEDNGSCSYDREYLLCEEHYLSRNQGISTINELINHGKWFHINGTKFPDIEQVTDIAPYNIVKVEALDIVQKQKKTKIVYE